MEFKGEFFPEEDPYKLVKELEERAKWYCKGFGGRLGAISGDLGNYVEGIQPERAKQRAETTFSTLLEIYATIPFNELQTHPDYDLLSSINADLLGLADEVRAILAGEKDVGELDQIIYSISSKGSAFRARLVELQNRIRQYHGFEKFAFKSTDISDRLWPDGIF